MNARRIAALLRELADAFDETVREQPRRAPTPPPEQKAKPEAVDRVRRRLRRIGVST